MRRFVVLGLCETVYAAVELELLPCLQRLEDLLTLSNKELGTLKLPLLQVLHVLLQEILVLGQRLPRRPPGLRLLRLLHTTAS